MCIKTVNLLKKSEREWVWSYLPLSLSFQIHHTHVHYWSQVSERFHNCHVRPLIVTVHVQLRAHTRTHTSVLQLFKKSHESLIQT